MFRFDHELFAENLRFQLSDTTVGHAYAIYEGEVLKQKGGGGLAVKAPRTPMHADRRITIGSASKTVTAAAVMRVLEILTSRGQAVTIDSRIAPYLPADWALGPHVNEMTIKDLLRHTSGLVQNADTFGALKQVIRKGAAQADWSARAATAYCNSNFTLFRIMIPFMLIGRDRIERQGDLAALDAAIQALEAELATAAPEERPAITAQIRALQAQRGMSYAETLEIRTAKLYVQFVRDEVLGPVGLGDVWINPRSQAETIHYYNVNDPGKVFEGYTDAEALRGVGAGFWFMSATELGRFIAGLRAGRIVSAATYQTMANNNTLGMKRGPSATGETVGHPGAFEMGDAGPGLRTQWLAFPDGVTAVIVYNSSNWRIVDGKIARDKDGRPIEVIPPSHMIVGRAYDAAFRFQHLSP